MFAGSESAAFHLTHQLLDRRSVDSARIMFARAVGCVVEGFVPIDAYLRTAVREEPGWRRQRSERELEERARLLLAHSLNPVAVVGQRLPSVQALQDVANRFFSNEAYPLRTRVQMVGASLHVAYDSAMLDHTAATAAARSAPPPARASRGGPQQLLQNLTLNQDAIACLVDVLRQQIGSRTAPGNPQPAAVRPPAEAADPNPFRALSRSLGQENSPVYLLASLLYAFPGMSLAEAAAELGCSARTLQRQLHPLGLSFPRVRLAGSVLRSLQLLGEGGSLSQVAVDAGFYDYPHYARIIKRSTGLSPQVIQGVLRQPRPASPLRETGQT